MSEDVHILLVEDEPQIRHLVRAALAGEGYAVAEAADVRAGRSAAAARRPDLLVLDLGLPDGDGTQLIRELRAWSELPILVLSARSDEQDKIQALDLGADDYLAKPFGVGELLARVRALVRRRIRSGEEAPRITFDQVEIDLARRQVCRAGEAVHLTNTEYRLLAVLVGSAGKVLTHRHLMQEVWGPDYAESGHYLRIYMSRLRQKLERDPAQPEHFLTETGVGYRFEA